jgi:uncharacterized lipoprotein YddW (UPF0748 family)
MKILKRTLVLLMTLVISLTFISPVKSAVEFEPLVRNSSNVKHFWSTEDVMIPITYEEKSTEFRGVWVATVYNLNMPLHSNEIQYKAAFRDLIGELQESNMNAMLFQVRPLNDALYESEYAPFSRYLTGSEGTAPGWDNLTWMINECHSNGIEFHAWMNPYRVANTTSTKEAYLNTLDEANFAKQHPELVISGNVDSNGRSPLILNPGEPAVKEYIRNVVKEIITKYDVDGVHFDDYFYPYSGISNDVSTYSTYKQVGQSIEDWRRENVNDVVRGVKEDIDLHNDSNTDNVKFGISPFGLWGSSASPTSSKYLPGGSYTGSSNLSTYHSQYADSKKWVEEGWVHYICPQVYFSFTHRTAPYADVVDWWAKIARGTDVDVIIGHAPSSASSGNWTTEEVSDQLRYNQKHPEIKGSVMYSAAFLDHSHMEYVEAHNWTVTPAKAWEDNETNIDVSVDGSLYGNVYTDDISVTLTATQTIYFKLDDGEWTLYNSAIPVAGSGAHVIYMKTVDVNNIESPVISENFPIQYMNTDIPSISVQGTKIGENFVVGSTLNAEATEDVYIKINHGSIGEWVLYTAPMVLDDAGGYSIYAKTIDSRGTESEEVLLNVTLQEECYDDPIITLSGTGNNPYYKELTVILSSDTDVMYKINDGSYAKYTTPIIFTTDGEYTIYYKNDDSCGTVISREFIIDNVIPENATVTINGDYDGSRYYISTTIVTLNVKDSETIEFRIHDGSKWTSWQTYTEPIELTYSGYFYVAYKVTDQAGNSSEVVEEKIRLKLPQNEDNIYVIRDGEMVTYYDSSIPIELPLYTEKSEEIRAVWIATVGNIDIAKHSSEEQYKAAIINMLNTIERNNFNTVFFQVRPMNDAFYDSDYAPWSRYLTGVEGVDPGWDILSFMIDECHRRGIEFHAWLNPYRVSTGTSSKEAQLDLLADDNFAKQNPDLVIADNKGKLILNPGERRVQVYIENVIRELVSKYDVDGIHFDDYFYSYGGTSTDADADNYNSQKEFGESLADWRRDNINTVVREVFELIEDHNADKDKTVLFGISPFGIWGSGEGGSNTSPYTMQSYSDQYADSKKWVEEGWVHYILPQLYWEFDHNTAPFADLVDWWAELCADNDVYLIVGQGFYRYDDDSWKDTNELPEQLRYMSQYDSIIGSSFFSYRTLNSQDKEVVETLDRLNNYYWKDYVTFPWESNVEKQEDPICTEDQTLTDGECIDNPPVCSDDQILENGNCVDKPVVCDDDHELKDGACILIEEPKTGCFGSIGSGSIVSTLFVTVIGLVSLVIGSGIIHDKRH